MLDQAIRYLEQGFSVIPIRPQGKEPLIKWEEYQKRKPTLDEVKKWWTQYPSANLGLVTGTISQLCVIDADGPTGLDSIKNMKLQSKVVVLTGNGRQLYFKHPGGNVCNAVRKYPGIDIRGDGGYVVAPPSIHPNGKRYSWLKPLAPAEVLPVFPQALFGANTAETARFKPEGWISRALEELNNGNRNDTFTKIVGRLHHDRWSAADIRGLLLHHAREVLFPESELDAIITSILRYPAGHNYQVLSGATGELNIYSPTDSYSRAEYEKRIQTNDQIGEYRTGFPRFDSLIKGLRKQEILTIAARTGVGKTNWLIGPAREFCKQGKTVLFFSTEMSFDTIWSRYKETLSDPNEFRNHAFYVCDEFTPDLGRIEAAIRKVEPDLFIFDHINQVSKEYGPLSEFMQGLKNLARMFDIPAIVAAQLNRSADFVEKGERVIPRLSMIQGSGVIEQVSAQVLLLQEMRVTPEYSEIRGYVDKNRYGDKGLCYFGLFKNPYRMEELLVP